MVLYLLTSESKKENKSIKVWFMEDVKQPSKNSMMCTIDVDTFLLFTKNTWIVDSDASYHITNDDTGLYDITNIHE